MTARRCRKTPALDARLAVREWLANTVGRRLPLDLVLAISRLQLTWYQLIYPRSIR